MPRPTSCRSSARVGGGCVFALTRSFQIRLSNSQVFPSSLRKTARVQFFFSLAPLKEREQSAVGRTRDACPLRRTGAGLAKPARLTALHCGVFNPWRPTSLCLGFRRRREVLRDIDPGPRIGPGGCHPRTPGTAVSETAGAGAVPHPRSDSLGRAPLCGWGCQRSIAIVKLCQR